MRSALRIESASVRGVPGRRCVQWAPRRCARTRAIGNNGLVPSTVNPPAESTMHVSVVCTGNICRSPIGEHVLRHALTEAGLADRVRVTSAGTGNWHVGGPADAASQRVLAAAGYTSDHVAHQITAAELTTVDLALACDLDHFRHLRQLTSDPAKVVLLRSFDPDADGDEVPDPYSGPDSEFVDVLRMIEAAAPGIVEEIRRRLA